MYMPHIDFTIIRVALREYGAGPFHVSQCNPDPQPMLSPAGCQAPWRLAEPQPLNHQPPPSDDAQSFAAMSPKMHGEQPSLSRSTVLNPKPFWSIPLYSPRIASPGQYEEHRGGRG